MEKNIFRTTLSQDPSTAAMQLFSGKNKDDPDSAASNLQRVQEEINDMKKDIKLLLTV